MAAKRARIDSVAGQQEMANNAMRGQPKPTEPLDAEETKHFGRIVRSKHISDISEADLDMMTHLAKVMRLQSIAVEAVKREGHLVPDQHGRPGVNPAVRSLDSFSKSVATLARMLGISASQRGSNNATQKARDAADRATREALGKAEESLI